MGFYVVIVVVCGTLCNKVIFLKKFLGSSEVIFFVCLFLFVVFI